MDQSLDKEYHITKLKTGYEHPTLGLIKDHSYNIFNDDEIWFYWQVLDTDFYVHYILNRYTGKLRKEMRQLTGNPKNDLYIVQVFNCLKAKQLF